MGKREASMFAAQLEGVDLDAPRAKRHKATASSPVAVKEETATVNVTDAGGALADDAQDDPAEVREKGLKLWQTIKDAVNKDGRVLSIDFLRLPSRRQYADYYNVIKRPIALDDIKRQLETGQYANFEEVKQDFEQCFKNAKRYNIKESQIWKDAKHLHRLAIKEANRLSGVEDAPDGDDIDINGDGSDAEGTDKKKKPPNMTRLLKTRLQKLVDKTDDQGRVLSAEFMDLPNKKQWSFYYKQIKRPQCFENIFKHLKRKEYATALDFANDVELVFSNALEFNQEHTPIWEDTIVLRDYFRHLMSDLPPPYTIPAYASQDHSTKIKLKMPTATQPASIVNATPTGGTTNASPRVRIPPLASGSGTPVSGSQSHTQAGATATPGPSTLPLPPAISPPAQTVTATSPTLPAAAANTADTSASNSSYAQHVFSYAQQKPQYPTTSYQAAAMASVRTPTLPNTNNIHVNTSRPAPKTPHVAHVPSIPPVPKTPQPPPPPPIKVPNQIPPSLLAAKSPTPVAMQNRRHLRHISVVTMPFGRRLDMDHKDGVKTWSVRLGPGETSIRVSDIKFLSANYEDGENSDDEGVKDKDKEKEKEGNGEKVPEAEAHEEEEEEPEEMPQEKPKRGRGRPRKKPRVSKPGEASPKDKGKSKAQNVPLEDEVQLKWNGTVASPLEGEKEIWEVSLTLGINVVEVGEKGGITWQMYLDKVVNA